MQEYPDFNVVMERANPSNLQSILEIYNQAVEDGGANCDTGPLSLFEIEEWYKRHDDNHTIFVMKKGGKIIGYSALSHWNGKPGYRHTVESTTYLHRQFRHGKLGRILLHHLMRQCEKLGYHLLIGQAHADNVGMLKIAERFGFKKMGEIPEVANINGKWVDIVLWGRYFGKDNPVANFETYVDL
jgi:phosphinothricin acetyltransferase